VKRFLARIFSFRALGATAWAAAISGCVSSGLYSKAVEERNTCKYRAEKLERDVQDRDARIDRLKNQVTTLQELGPNRPTVLFGPTSVEIVSRSGGMNFDNKDGDDGIMIYLRPRDADGDAVKAPGKVTIDLLDLSEPGSPKSVAVCKFEDPESLRKMWHSQLLTQHYSLRCPFPPDAILPDSRKLLASVAFTDVNTGATYKAEREVTFHRRSD
jgi:hypothetical protein